MRDYSLGPCIPTNGSHYALLEYVLNLGPSGLALEFGVGKGESTRLIAARIPVIGFDSFQGLPEDWRPEFPAGSFAQAHLPAIDNADLVVGLFSDTLPECDFIGINIELLHIDCDLYSSTKTVLKHIGPHLNPGAYVVFDEFHGYDGAEKDEQQAWREYAEQTEISWQVIGHTFQQWAIQLQGRAG